jgi:hypothetical protein
LENNSNFNSQFVDSVSARDFPQSFPATSSNEDIIDLQSLPKPVSPQIQFDHADDDYYETFGKETDKDLSDMVSIPKQITLKNDNAPYYSGLLLITNLSQDALIYKVLWYLHKNGTRATLL